MSTVWNGPYKPNNPRTIHGAQKRGWHVVQVPRNYMDRYDITWLGIGLWASRHSNGYFLDNFLLRQFAFERDEDASKFIFQFAL